MFNWYQLNGYYYRRTTYHCKPCVAITNGITRLLLLDKPTLNDAKLFISTYL
jgi:hypothetical protein